MAGRQCCVYLRREFQLKHFGFVDVDHARFSYLQWRVPAGAVLLYRFVLAVYCIFWLVYVSATEGSPGNPIYAYLTQWTYLMLTIYLFLHFLVCVISVCKRGGSLWKSLTPEEHKRMFHELHVQPVLLEYEVFHGGDLGVNENDRETIAPLPWIFKIVWIFYNVTSTGCLMVTLIFWVFLFPQLNITGHELMVNIQVHGVTSFIIILEHVMSALPYRLLHSIYPIIYSGIYVVFSGIYYAEDHRHVLYPHVLDWSEPRTTAVVLSLTGFVVMPILQLFLFAVDKLRLSLYNRISDDRKPSLQDLK